MKASTAARWTVVSLIAMAVGFWFVKESKHAMDATTPVVVTGVVGVLLWTAGFVSLARLVSNGLHESSRP